jgi:hypothetical protein
MSSDDQEDDMKTLITNDTKEPPFNKFTYMVIFLFGISSLLAWNSCLTALDFFFAKLHTNSFDPYFMFGILMNCPNFVMTVLSVFIQDKITVKTRLIASLIGTMTLSLSMPLIAQYLTSEDSKSLADILISLVIIVLGLFSAFLQGGTFGYGAMFPPIMMGAVMFGQGASGIICNIIRIFLIIILPPA